MTNSKNLIQITPLTQEEMEKWPDVARLSTLIDFYKLELQFSQVSPDDQKWAKMAQVDISEMVEESKEVCQIYQHTIQILSQLLENMVYERRSGLINVRLGYNSTEGLLMPIADDAENFMNLMELDTDDLYSREGHSLHKICSNLKIYFDKNKWVIGE